MSLPILHVVRRRSTPITITTDGHDHRVIVYGQALGGMPASGAVLHDAPVCDAEREWIDEVLFCRMAPNSSIITANGAPPHTTPTA